MREPNTENLNECLSDHLELIKDKIWNDANLMAKKDESSSMTVEHLHGAISKYTSVSELEVKPTWWARNLGKIHVTSLGVFTLLAIVFALLGYLAISGSVENLKDEGKGFLEIAKIFAGAIVGSASANAVGNRSRRKSKDSEN